MLRRFIRFAFAWLALVLAAALVAPPVARAQVRAAVTMSVAVDASHAPQGILHVRERIAVTPGLLTLMYPEWIPSEHTPAGPIVNLAALTIAAGATPLRWARDLVDPFAFHVDVPPGTASLDVSFDYLGTPIGQYSSQRLASANILVLTWNKVLLTPAVDDYRTITIAPSVTLPGDDWQFATALDTQTHAGAELTFAPVTMDQLIDSPLDAGINVRRWPLGSIDGAPVAIAVFADTPEDLAGDAAIAKVRALVAQVARLYRARHFNHYTFLLTVSDVLPGEGVEHAQSTDVGSDADFLTNPESLLRNADLLAHEFNHSWNGKYRRPADLATPNLHVPMRDDLLWVYEGLTEFYGYLLAARAGFLTPQQYRDHLAGIYATLDTTTGRATNPLADTAIAAPILYGAPQAFQSARRDVDFYGESELMWLEADLIIHKLSGGKRSIDDFARAFFGRASTGPQVVTYTRADIIAALNAVQAYDWAGFFEARVDRVAPHPPDAFTPAGWKLAFAPSPAAYFSALEHGKFDARYSLGIVGGMKGLVADVIAGSPAQRAGLAPGDTIVAVDDRAVSDNAVLGAMLDAALTRAAAGGAAVRVLALGGGIYREIVMPYSGGPRYPVLEAIPGAADALDEIRAPLAP